MELSNELIEEMLEFGKEKGYDEGTIEVSRHMIKSDSSNAYKFLIELRDLLRSRHGMNSLTSELEIMDILSIDEFISKRVDKLNDQIKLTELFEKIEPDRRIDNPYEEKQEYDKSLFDKAVALVEEKSSDAYPVLRQITNMIATEYGMINPEDELKLIEDLDPETYISLKLKKLNDQIVVAQLYDELEGKRRKSNQ